MRLVISREYFEPLVYLPFVQAFDFVYSQFYPIPLPVATIILMLISLVLAIKRGIKKQIKFNFVLVLLIFIVLTINSLIALSIYSFNTKLDSFFNLVGLIYISFLILNYGRDIKSKSSVISKMVNSYIFIAIVLIVLKVIDNNYIFDFQDIRSGTYIFGSNTFIVTLYGFSILFLLLRNPKKYYLYLFLSIIFSFLFISRGGIIFGFIALIAELLNRNRLKIKSKIFLIFATISIVSASYFIFSEIQETFSRIFEQGNFISLYTSNTRYLLFLESTSLINENRNIMFFGVGIDQFRYLNIQAYSDPHNFLIDLIFLGGIPLLILVFYLLLVTVIKSKNRTLILLYYLFALFEGVAVFHFRGEVISGYFMMLMIWIFLAVYLEKKFDLN